MVTKNVCCQSPCGLPRVGYFLGMGVCCDEGDILCGWSDELVYLRNAAVDLPRIVKEVKQFGFPPLFSTQRGQRRKPTKNGQISGEISIGMAVSCPRDVHTQRVHRRAGSEVQGSEMKNGANTNTPICGVRESGNYRLEVRPLFETEAEILQGKKPTLERDQ